MFSSLLRQFILILNCVDCRSRGCIGRTFAMLEIKAVLATLLRQFVFAPAEGQEIEPLLSFVVRPKVKGEHKSSLPLKVSKVAF